jgi:hypothetical protein
MPANEPGCLHKRSRILRQSMTPWSIFLILVDYGDEMAVRLTPNHHVANVLDNTGDVQHPAFTG